MSTNTCLCGHDRYRHGPNAAGPHSGQCRAACGCLWFRPRTVSGEAENWLAARFPDKSATRDGAA